MTSITTSPNHPLTTTNAFHEGNWSGKKRRPIDPEETGSAAKTLPYDSEIVQPQAKRARTIDDVLSSLSLHAPDPPGNFSCNKRTHNDNDSGVEVESGRSPKMARSGDSASPFNKGENNGHGNSAVNQQQMDPTGIREDSPTNITSRQIFDPSTQQITSGASPSGQAGCNDTSVDDSDCESNSSVASSVSEGSIRNAMYQLVFGRRNPQPSLNGSVGCGQRYDKVDTKIEEMIRRSRLEAAIKSKKKENEEAARGMDIDWIPGLP